MTYNLHDNQLSEPLNEIIELNLDVLVIQEMRIQNETEVIQIANKLGMNHFTSDDYNLSLYGIL